MKRHEVSDDQWEAIHPILPRRTAKTGRPPSDPRLMLNGILWILRTGAPWRDLPERFGPWQTVYDHFARWRKQGVYDRILESLHIRLDADGEIDWDLWCIDGSSVRATRAAAGPAKKVAAATRTSRKTTLWAAREVDSAVNSTWLLTVEVTAGQVHDSTCVESVMDRIAIPQPVGRPRKRPSMLAGDKGYRCHRVRDWLRRYGITPLIPRKDNEHLRHDGRSTFDKQTYRRRSIVEQTIGWLKECRRIGTRFEKLAMIQRCLKIAFPDRT